MYRAETDGETLGRPKLNMESNKDTEMRWHMEEAPTTTLNLINHPVLSSILPFLSNGCAAGDPCLINRYFHYLCSNELASIIPNGFTVGFDKNRISLFVSSLDLENMNYMLFNLFLQISYYQISI